MELVRRMAAHRGGPARSLLVEEFHQGLSHALMRGVGKQLRSLLMIQSSVTPPLHQHNPIAKKAPRPPHSSPTLNNIVTPGLPLTPLEPG